MLLRAEILKDRFLIESGHFLVLVAAVVAFKCDSIEDGFYGGEVDLLLV